MMVGAYMLITFGPILKMNTWVSLVVALASAVVIGLAFEFLFVRALLGLGFLAMPVAAEAGEMYPRMA